MTNETITTSRCAHCASTFEVTNEVLGIPEEALTSNNLAHARTIAAWWFEPKTCLRCGKTYTPINTRVVTDRFVLAAINTVKGER